MPEQPDVADDVQTMTVDGMPVPRDAGLLAFLRRLTSAIGAPTAAAPSSGLRVAAVSLLVIGGLAAVITIALGAVGAALPDVAFTWSEFLGTSPWYLGYAVRVALGVVVLRHGAENAAAAWFCITIGFELLDELAGVLPDALTAVAADPWAIAATTLAEWWLVGILGIVGLQLAVRLPVGGVEDPVRRWAHAAWVLAAVPPLAFATQRLVPVPWYAGEPTIVNPFHIRLPEGVAAGITAVHDLSEFLFFVGLAVVLLRYVRSAPAMRRRLRWMLGVLVVAVGSTVTILLFPDMPPGLLSTVSATAVVAVPVFVALTLLGPDGVDVDQVLRRSLVYGVMWLAIAGLYVGAGALVGTAAGQRLPASSAAVITVAATLAFQPVRRWLERLADRWVFGSRADPAHLVADLGATLQHTYEVDELLPLIEDTLRRGLSVEWVRIRLEADRPTLEEGEETGAAVLRTPIMLGDERLGTIECGASPTRPLGPDDAAVVETFAGQAALAVANVQLTRQLAANAEQLRASRARLVRAQETERRRIERNIHDGVQQELVSLIQHTGEIERAHADGTPVDDRLAELRNELARLLTTLRELAAGIHPSLLTDRGLLPAIEALVARHPVPVAVRVDRRLRDERFAEAVEGAGYFTVAECLANSLKHAEASSVEVTLARQNGCLQIEVSDDGVGYAPAAAGAGTGLYNLAARLEALGGGLAIESRPGAGTTVRANLTTTVGEGPES